MSESFLAELPVPSMGATVNEMTVISVYVKPGQTVAKGERLAEFESEKSAFDFECPAAGTIDSILVRAGDIVECGSAFLRIITTDPAVAHLKSSAARASTSTPPPAPAAAAPTAVKPSVANAAPKPTPAPPIAIQEPQRLPGLVTRALHPQWTPRARKVAEEHGLPESAFEGIQGTGPGGRISGDDVVRWIANRRESPSSAPAVAPKPELTTVDPFAAETVRLAGLGFAVPSKIRLNSDILSQFPGKTEEEIFRLTGIRERYYASESESATGLAVTAAKRALAASGIDPTTIDGVIMATILPDQPVPSMASSLAGELGMRNAFAFDLNAACSGWLYALEVGRSLIRCGTAKKVLVATAELLSRITNPNDIATAFLFGDGAGAAILTDEKEGHRLGRMHLSGDANYYAAIQRTGGGARMPIPGSSGDLDKFFLEMDGPAVFKQAVGGFTRILEGVMARYNLKPEQVGWVVPHQANERILRAVSQRIGIPFERFVVTIGRYGNTSAASVSMALGWAEQEGLLNHGDKILFCSVGAGLTFAGGLLEW
jgi:3-oxoacyl-(acyl-carrier-protein) synthase III